MNTRVLFFGGFLSTLHDMRAWLASAEDQRPDIDFYAYPYPHGAGAGLQEALNGFGNDRFDQIIAMIRGAPDHQHIIVGHSSGCAIANAVVSGMGDAPTGAQNYRLVALDGFRPDDMIFANHSDTTCWHAYCGNAKSRNWDIENEGKPWFKKYEATDCYTEWALHFSLCNTAASDRTVHQITDGYNNVHANLCFLT
jgi:pimeloyl-ACP methyl ester carboxylesterase